MHGSEPPLAAFVNPADSSRHTSSANTAIYPNLGLLTLMTAAREEFVGETMDWAYLDGAVHGNEVLREYLIAHVSQLKVLSLTCLTANYGAGLALARELLGLNPAITVIVGNDHFSALAERCVTNRPEISYGFNGNDIVRSFASFVHDVCTSNLGDLSGYPGLVWRDADRAVHINREDPSEYQDLPLVDYELMDSAIPHRDRYLAGQQDTYFFMRQRALRSQVIDIGRGCIKFAGPRLPTGVPANACDFCGIIPGSKEIITPDARRAWDIIKNAYDHGYNYYYVTADELPLTMWPMLRNMMAAPPDWWRDLSLDERPAMFGYTRAEAFATSSDRIQALIDNLGFDHFFIGFDGLSDVSLQVMNKQPAGGRGRHDSPMSHNLRALDEMVTDGGLITAGLVLTHLGITKEIMEANFDVLEQIVDSHPRTFAALDFGALCPIPGSQSFTYLTHPEHAERRAAQFGLRVDRAYLESRAEHYRSADELDMDELVDDFTRGCCPDISPELVEDHLGRVNDLAERHGIVIGGAV